MIDIFFRYVVFKFKSLKLSFSSFLYRFKLLSLRVIFNYLCSYAFHLRYSSLQDKPSEL